MADNNNLYNSDQEYWNKRYNGECYFYGENPNDFLVSNVERFQRGGKILCLSEGEGRNAIFLALKGFEVTAVDFSSKAKEKAMALAVKNKVEIEYDIADLKNYDLGEDKWDGIISISAHLPTAIKKHLHPAIKRGLKKKGIFLLEGFNTQQLNYNGGGPKDLDKLFSKPQLEKDFSDLSIILSEDILRDVAHGKSPKQKASVTQFVVTK